MYTFGTYIFLVHMFFFERSDLMSTLFHFLYTLLSISYYIIQHNGDFISVFFKKEYQTITVAFVHYKFRCIHYRINYASTMFLFPSILPQ